MITRLTWLLLILSTLGFGQQAFETLDLLDSSGTFHIRLTAPASLSGNTGVTLPVATGSAGCVIDAGGSGVLTVGSCILTPPVVLSGTTGGNILTVTQSGAGNAAIITGNTSVTANTSGTAFTVTQNGSGNAVQILGGQPVVISGLLTQSGTTPLWYTQANGVSFARNFTSRYTFNSIGDVAQTGTFTASGVLITPTSGSFDVSFTGGQIGLCTVTCTNANQTLFLVICVNDSANKCGGSQPQGTLVVASTPGFNGSYTYAANAFQTSLGTMYITGAGFGYFQNAVVTNGFTALGSANATGTVTPNGTSVVWVSGNVFDPSMQGGVFKILGVGDFIVASVLSPTQLVLTTSAGTPGTKSYTYNGDAFRAIVSGLLGAAIHNDGTAYFSNPAANVGFAVDAFNFSGAGGAAIRATASGGGGAAISAVGNGAIAVLGVGGANGTGGNFTATGAGGTALTVAGTGGAAGLVVVGGCTGCGGGTGTVTSIATTSPITGGTITTTGTIGCATCITTSTSKLVQSGFNQFVTGVKTINPTGLSSTSVCVANEGVVGTPTEFIGVSAVSGTSATFTSSNPASGNFFHWECTN